MAPATSTEPLTEAVERRWGLLDALLAFIAAYGLSITVASVWIGATGAELDSLGTSAAGLVGLWAGLGGGAWFAARYRGSGSVVRDFGLRFHVPFDLVGIPLGVGCQYLVGLLIALPAEWFVDDADDLVRARAEDIAERAGDDLAFFVLAVLLVVGAPLFEELFYRGLLLRSLARWLPAVAAVAVSAVLFAVVHDAETLEAWVIQGVALGAFAAILGAIAVRTRRLGLAVVTHASFNLVTVLALYAQRN